MPTYVETSALLRALLEGDRPVLDAIRNSADDSVTSRVTFVEAERSIVRAVLENRLRSPERREAKKGLREFRERADVIAIDEEILVRASQPFPLEPVRTLDALHLASILACDVRAGGGLTVVSCDARIRTNADALGLDVLPRAT